MVFLEVVADSDCYCCWVAVVAVEVSEAVAVEVWVCFFLLQL